MQGRPDTKEGYFFTFFTTDIYPLRRKMLDFYQKFGLLHL
jgi:hypothetical protein